MTSSRHPTKDPASRIAFDDALPHGPVLPADAAAAKQDSSTETRPQSQAPHSVPAAEKAYLSSDADFVSKVIGRMGVKLPVATDGRYLDLGKIGSGGMSQVHRAIDRSLQREVAIKRLDNDKVAGPESLHRFIEEARVTGRLDHPNIVPIHELALDNSGQFYFSMKLVQGQNLEEVIQEAGEQRLDADRLSEMLQVMLKVCDAVAFAHDRRVIHRDIKPSNIMVGPFGQVYIMDWGLARVLSSPADHPPEIIAEEDTLLDFDVPGSVMGTPAYMAPEQVEGAHDTIDERTDVFALGATLYHIITGRPPFRGKNYYTLLMEALNCAPEAPELVVGDRVPKELCRITKKAMQRRPDDRYPSVAALRLDIERLLRGVWHLPTETVAAGHDIVRQGEQGHSAFIISSGHCAVYNEQGDTRVELRRLGPGDVFGEMAIFSAAPRSATVTALDEVELRVVTQEALSSGLSLETWAGQFVKVLTDRFREVEGCLRQAEDTLRRHDLPIPQPASGGPKPTD